MFNLEICSENRAAAAFFPSSFIHLSRKINGAKNLSRVQKSFFLQKAMTKKMANFPWPKMSLKNRVKWGLANRIQKDKRGGENNKNLIRFGKTFFLGCKMWRLFFVSTLLQMIYGCKKFFFRSEQKSFQHCNTSKQKCRQKFCFRLMILTFWRLWKVETGDFFLTLAPFDRMTFWRASPDFFSPAYWDHFFAALEMRSNPAPFFSEKLCYKSNFVMHCKF